MMRTSRTDFVHAAAILIVVMTVGVGCRPKMVDSNVHASDGAAACDLVAMESAIALQGVLKALQSDATACLDEQPEEASAAIRDDVVSQVQPEPSQEESGLSLVDVPKKADVVVVVGWEVMNDVLTVAAERALDGSSASQVDATQLRRQVHEVVSLFSETIRPFGGRIGVTLYYSYEDLYSLIKSRFIDPAIFGYSGIGHRIVHRRYARGRGLVYRLVTQILSEELAKYDVIARGEVARASTDLVRLNFLRADRSVNTSQESFLTLWLDNKIAGRSFGYREVKLLAEQLTAYYKQLVAANR